MSLSRILLLLERSVPALTFLADTDVAAATASQSVHHHDFVCPRVAGGVHVGGDDVVDGGQWSGHVGRNGGPEHRHPEPQGKLFSTTTTN